MTNVPFRGDTKRWCLINHAYLAVRMVGFTDSLSPATSNSRQSKLNYRHYVRRYVVQIIQTLDPPVYRVTLYYYQSFPYVIYEQLNGTLFITTVETMFENFYLTVSVSSWKKRKKKKITTSSKLKNSNHVAFTMQEPVKSNNFVSTFVKAILKLLARSISRSNILRTINKRASHCF